MGKPVLFVGGPVDGQRMILPDGRERYEFREYPPVLPSELADEAMLDDSTIRRHFYRRLPIAAAEQPLSIFAHEELTVGEAFGRLIDRYPGPKVGRA